MHEDCTLDRRQRAGGLRVQLAFLLSLWLSLATAVVSAVAPSGLPSTRSVGSAFDPSTTIVALRSRPPVEAKTAILRIGEGDGTGFGGGAGLLAIAPAVVTTGVAVAYAATLPLAAFTLSSRAIGLARYARPPPAA